METKPKKNLLYEELNTNKLITYPKNNENTLSSSISLTPIEEKCFSIILNILQKNNLNSTIIRVAGGWVRDKLLGKNSVDIDIAISNIKGSQLALLINNELYPGQDKVGIMKQNAEKGKHLETATIKICDIWIDFVNLRSEKENVIGTPLEDAQRRDLSINSLFYNINEKKVEDFTEKGIKDLKNGNIETPIDAKITFGDDTLRILRMLRFALKYKFNISDNINNCIEENIKYYREQFYNNISPERIEKELFQILKMENSAFAIAYLFKFNLLDVILQVQKFSSDFNEKNNYVYLVTTNIYIIGEYLLTKLKLFFIENNNDFNKVDFGLLLLTICFRKFEVKFGKEKTTINKLILREIFKTSNDYIRENSTMNNAIDEFISIVNKNDFDRLTTGKILRKIHYNNFYKMLYSCIAFEYVNEIKADNIISELNEEILQKIKQKYIKFYEFVKNENLMHIDELKPLFNGQEIIKMLEIKPGKEVGKLMDLLLDKQIENQDFDKDSAIIFLNKKKEELELDKSYDSTPSKSGKKKGKKNKKNSGQ